MEKVSAVLLGALPSPKLSVQQQIPSSYHSAIISANRIGGFMLV